MCPHGSEGDTGALSHEAATSTPESVEEAVHGTDASAPPMRIWLCGTLRVEAGGLGVRELLARRQARLLLALLVLRRGRPCHRAELVEALWPGSASQRHGASLRVLLSAVRGALGGGSLVGRASVQLVLPDDAWVDVEQAHAKLEEAQSAAAQGRWAQAARAAAAVGELLREPLLAGESAAWIDEARRDVDKLRIEAMQTRATAELEAGRPREAERAARELIAGLPFREEGHRLLMQALARQGNVAEALLAYERLRELLRDELGSSPSASTAGLHTRLLRQDDEGVGADAPAEGVRQTALPAPLTQLPATPLVGRANELDAVLAAAKVAAGGVRRAVFFSGEPGIGKTRLAAEAARRVGRERALVLYGRCDEHALTAYQPFVEMIEQYVSLCPPAVLAEELSGTDAGELARLVPAVANRVPKPATGASSAVDRYRLFGAVGDLLASAAKHATLLLVLEDLHWADRSTLLMLRHLLRMPRQLPMLVVANYRSTEQLTPEHPLPELLADLARDRLIERIALDGLCPAEVTRLLGEVAGAPAQAWLARTVHRETAGNPLYVHEIARHLSETGAFVGQEGDEPPDGLSIEHFGVPEGVKDVIEGRLSRLTKATNEVLAVASVVGREFSMDLLERCCDVPEGALIDALEEALSAQVLTETPPEGSFTFSHMLVRATLYEQLSSVRRLRLHRLAAKALEDLHATDLEPRLPEIAHHYVAAGARGDPAKAVEYSLRAGHRALGQLAFEAAAAHYDAALALVGPAQDERRLEGLLGLGEARWGTGDFEGARTAFGAAAGIARTRGRVEQFAIAALGFGGRMAFGAGVRDDEVIELLEAALDGLADGHGALRARVLARLGEALTFCDTEGRRAGLCAEAVRLARGVGDPAVLASVLTNVHWALWSPDNPSERLAIADEIVDSAVRAGDVALEVDGQLWRVADLLELGEIARADRELEAWAHLARETGQRYQLWAVACVRGLRSLMAGRIVEAEAQAMQALEIGQRDRNQNSLQIFGVQIAGVRREQGRYQELEDGTKMFVEQYPGIPTWRCALAFLYADAGRHEAARRELEILGADEFAALPRDMFWLADVALVGQACWMAGDVERARVLYDQLLPYARRNVTAGAIAACWGSASRILALLAATLGRRAEACRHFEEAIEMNGAIGAVNWQARSRVEYAGMLLADGDAPSRELARELVNEALSTAEELELEDLRARARALDADLSRR